MSPLIRWKFSSMFDSCKVIDSPETRFKHESKTFMALSLINLQSNIFFLFISSFCICSPNEITIKIIKLDSFVMWVFLTLFALAYRFVFFCGRKFELIELSSSSCVASVFFLSFV